MNVPVVRGKPGTVLHVISSLGSLGGGAEMQLLLLLQHRTAQWKHIVAYRKPRVLLREEFKKIGVKTVWLGEGGFFQQVARLMRVARAESADVIHTHLFEANTLGRVAGRLLRVPVVTSLVSTTDVAERIASGAYAQPWKYRLSLELEGLTGRWGTFRFIAISNAVKESAVRALRVPPSRFRVVYRAVGNDPSAPGDVKRPLGPGPTLISVGRLIPSKGHDLLIRMLSSVLEKWPEATLQIVGQGPDQASLERLARELGVSEHVHFLGFRPDVNQLLQQADLFVYASWIEGFSLVIAEANAVGLPVVTVDLPVTRETAPPRSVLFVERDARAFADAVLHVLDNLEAFRLAAQEESVVVRERFSVDAYVRGTEVVYGEALEVRAPRPVRDQRTA